MLELWPIILLGWPAILVSNVLSVMGIVHRRPARLLFAGVLAAPFALYLAASPGFSWLGVIIPFFFFGASITIYYDRINLAWSLLAPFLGVSVWLAIAAMSP
jgi:hypothetical protein